MSSNGSVLKIATVPGGWFPPCAMINLYNRPNCDTLAYPLPQIMLSILTFASIPYELIPHPKPYYGEIVDGTYFDGIFGSLTRGEIDTVSSTWIETRHRREHFTFSFPLYKYKLLFLTKLNQPGLESSTWLLFTVFSTQTWTLLLLSISSIFFYLLIVSKKAKVKSNKLMRMNKPSVKMALAIVGITVTIFSNLYQGTLLAKLLTQPGQTAFTDVWQMVKMIESGQLKLVLKEPGDYRHQELMYSDRHFYKELREATKHNPFIFQSNFTKAIEMVAEGTHVYPLFSTQTGRAKQIDCRVTHIESDATEIPELGAGFMMSNKSIWIGTINKAILHFQQHIENIIAQYMKRNEGKAISKCAGEIAKPGSKPLDILSLSGAVAILLVGALIATLLFIWENANKYFKKQRDQVKDLNNIVVVEQL